MTVVAKQMKIKRSSVQYIWRRYGTEDLSHRRSYWGSGTKHDEWISAYQRGKTTGQIAMRAGVTPSAVVNALRKRSPTGRATDLRKEME